MPDPDVAVLPQKIHGMPTSEYADVLRERLPDSDVALARTPEEARDLLTRATVATGQWVDPDVLDEASLELFACVFAGTDHLPLEDLAAHDVAVTSAAGVHAPNVSEHVLGAILSFTRGFHTAFRLRERREWRSFQAHELQGSTVTIVGLGNIGRAVVERLDPFGVDTVGVRYTPEKGGPTDEVYGFDGIHDAVVDADYLVLACPLTDATEGLVDREVFETMAADGVLVNVARGGVVDTDDLVTALRWGQIRGAALDVTDPEPLPEDHPLWGLENVLLTPHNAGHTPAYFERLADILEQNLAHVAETGAYEGLQNQVL